MAFEICFTDQPDITEDDGNRHAVGLITIGDFKEGFHSSLFEWGKHSYQSQWLDALERFLGGDDRAVLITFYVNPNESSNLEWWALYRGKGDVVHIQNHLLFYNQLDREFSIAEAGSFLKDRETMSDGDEISEWHTTLSDLECCLMQMKHQFKKN